MAQSKKALVIGIGEYPAGSGWSKINGDRDIDIICKFLTNNGFAQSEIATLKNAQATKENIVRQFEFIATTAKPGDQIYIHFSGHGQQVTDLDGDEDDGWDEAWISYDARKTYIKGQYKGENHLIDDEINLLLQGIRKKIGPLGQLTVVVDACHSGDSSRGEDDEDEGLITRGTDDKFIIPTGASNKKTDKKPIQWVLISACKSYQNNYECKTEDGYYGSLSYALYLYKDKIGKRPLSEVGKDIAATLVKLVTKTQTIQIDSPDGSTSELLFGE